MKKTVLTFVLTLLCVLFSVAAYAETTTVMVYMCGSNLESIYGAATKDIQEMLLSGMDPDLTHVYILAGGSSDWRNAPISENRGGLFTLSKKKHDNTIKLRALEANRDLLNMGSGETLSSFLDYCSDASVTDRYILILWDHGGGPVNGVCWDEVNDGDHLTIEEIVKALADSSFHEKKLECVGFDSCLMGSTEVASRLSPYANYMISSQAEEPVCGWDYSFLQALENDADGAETGKRIIDAYFSVPQKTTCDLTMSCIDLSRTDEIEACMDSYFRKLADGLSERTFSDMAKLRINATGFGKSMETRTAPSGYDLVDVVSLIDSYAEKYPTEAKSARDSIESAVVYNRTNVEGSCGLSVYHPFRNQDKYTSEWKDTYEKLGFCPGYTSYIQSYGSIMTGEHLETWDNLNDITVSEDGFTASLNITQSQADNLASAKLIVLARNMYDVADLSLTKLYESEPFTCDGTQISASYKLRTLHAYNAVGLTALTGSISYTVTAEGTYMVEYYPNEYDGTVWQTPIIGEYIDAGHGRLILKQYHVFDELTGTFSTRADVDLSKYKALTVYNDYRNQTINEKGEYLPFDEWRDDVHTDTITVSRVYINRPEFVLRFTDDLVKSEMLCMGFEITDTQGNRYMSELASTGIGNLKIFSSESATFYAGLPYAAAMQIIWDENAIRYVVQVNNNFPYEMIAYISDVEVNDVSVLPHIMTPSGNGTMNERLRRAYWLPESHNFLTVSFDRSVLDEKAIGDQIHKISAKLTVVINDPEQNIYQMYFEANPEISASAIFHGESEQNSYDSDWIELKFHRKMLKDSDFSIGADLLLRSGSSDKSEILCDVFFTNTTPYDLLFGISNVKINDIPMDASHNRFSADGTGAEYSPGKHCLAPGDKRSAVIRLNYKDIAKLKPDVSLNKLSFSLITWEILNGEPDVRSCLPIELPFSIPLADFYPDTDFLPSQRPYQAGKEEHYWDDNNSKLLCSYDNCNIYMNGFFTQEKKTCLLLRLENTSLDKNEIYSVHLGNGFINDDMADIGTTPCMEIENRNDRIKLFGLQKEPWQGVKGVSIYVQPGEKKYSYVSMIPTNEQTQVDRISFGAYINHTGSPGSNIFFDRIDIEPAGIIPLAAGKEGIVPMRYFNISASQKSPDVVSVEGVFEPGVNMAHDQEIIHKDLLLEAEAGESITEASYMILKKITGEKELAEMNIVNQLMWMIDAEEQELGDITLETEVAALDTSSIISFEDKDNWICFGMGTLSVAENGEYAQAEYPMLIPTIHTRDGEYPLSVETIVDVEESLLYAYSLGQIGFQSSTFPDTSIGRPVNAFVVFSDQDRQGVCAGELTYPIYSELADILYQGMHFLCLDKIEDDSEPVFQDNPNWELLRLYQYQMIDSIPIEVTLQPITEQDNYYVMFWYHNTDGVAKATYPKPLSMFLSSQS